MSLRAPSLSLRTPLILMTLLLMSPQWARGAVGGEPAGPTIPGAWPLGSDELTQVQLDVWTAEDGLPLSAVDRLVQTREGFLWLATQEGIVRFDGYDFDTYSKANSDITSNSIYALHVGADGTLWVGTRGGGLAKFREGSLSAVRIPGLDGVSISSVTDDPDGNLLLGLADSTALRVVLSGDDEPEVQALGSAEIVGITKVLTDESGAVWIGTREHGLFRVGQGVTTSFRQTGALPHTFITDLSIAPDGSIWVAAEKHGIARIQGYRIHTYGQESGLPDDAVRAILADPNGTVWIGTQQSGLWRLAGGVVSQPGGLSGAARRDVRDILFDREGSVWFATDQGLHRIRHARFKTYTDTEGFPSAYVQTTMEASDGAVWVGTDKGAARMRNGVVDRTFPEIGEQLILSLAEAADGSIWIGTLGNGLFRYRDGSLTRRTEAGGQLPDDRVFALHAGPSGIWMGSRRGAARLDADGYQELTTEHGLGSNDVTAILETEDRDLWLGTYDAGLHLVRNGSVVAQYLPGTFVTTIFADSEGDIWVGIREGGLVLVRDGIAYEYRVVDGMLSDNVLAIAEDEDGGIWMTSNIGLSRASKAQLLDFAHGRVERVEPDVFTDRDGLLSREFNGGTQPSSWAGSEGRLWFPSPAGLVSVNPYQRNEVAPYVVIERFEVDEVIGSVRGGVVLQPGAQRIDISFTAPTFLATAKTRYSFKLEGYDRGWLNLTPGGNRTVSYTNLGPGQYTFRVRAQNGDGVWSENEATLSFELLPFYWQTLWFRVLCVLLICAVAAWMVHRRMAAMRARAAELESLVDERTKDLRLAMQQTEEALLQTEAARREAEKQRELAEESRSVIEQQANQLLEMDRIKTRFFNNISHEFRTPLTLNIGPMENALLGEYGTVSEPLRRQLEVMLRNSRRLLRLINQLLDLSKLESGRMKLKVMDGSLVELLEGIVFSFTSFAERKSLELTFDNRVEKAEFLFDPLGLEKVFFNLLSNAVKFTPDDGTITVRLEETELETPDGACPALAVSVSDTGEGIPESELVHIFDRFHQVDGTVSKVQEGTGIGLALVKELVELHGGQIEVRSLVGEGTEFRVVLPTEAARLGAHEVIVDGYAEQPVHRGPMVEMAVFDEDEEAESTVALAPEDAPVVLVVDDSPDIRAYVAECLRLKYHVVTAENGQIGVQKAKAIRPNLIVSDVMMPVMNGFDLCRAIREDEQVRHIPIVLVTSKATAEDKIEGLEAGADDYVAKPFSARELLARVGNLVRVQAQKSSLERLNSDLLATNTALRQASEMKSQLLSIASHDMKNPLTAIREFARILKEESSESHQLELLEMIFDSSNDMLALISQLLDSAALEGGSLEVSRRRTDLVDLAERVVERNVRMADRKGQVIHMTLDDPEDCSIAVDGERVREAMDNLISNAIKYSPLQSNIYVSLRRGASDVRFSVRDEGPGLTEDDMSRVFGKFQKLSARPTGGETSTGLGLSIVKQIVELHGGQVSADSNPERGAVFSFSLPDTQEPRLDRPARPRGTRAQDGHGSTEGQQA